MKKFREISELKKLPAFPKCLWSVLTKKFEAVGPSPLQVSEALSSVFDEIKYYKSPKAITIRNGKIVSPIQYLRFGGIWKWHSVEFQDFLADQILREINFQEAT